MNPDEQPVYIADPNQYSAYSGGPAQVMRGDRADLIDKIKPDVAVEYLRHRLLGEVMIDGEWQQIKAYQDLSLSEAGAWQISNLILSVSTLNTSLSKLNDLEIKNRVLSICRTAQYMCNQHWIDYNIRDTSQLRFVHECMFSAALVVLKQADGASIQELLKGTVQENRNIMTEQRPQGKIKRWLGL